MRKLKWARVGGYECSSKGDKRFSAFNARIRAFDNQPIEVLYQCTNEYGKGCDPEGFDYRRGKGRPSCNGKDRNELYQGFKELWSFWMAENIDLVFELYDLASNHDYTLSDCFAHTEINQARALSELINEFFSL